MEDNLKDERSLFQTSVDSDSDEWKRIIKLVDETNSTDGAMD